MSSKNSYLNLMKNKADKLNTVRFDHKNEDETVTLSYFDGDNWKELSNLGGSGGPIGSLGKGSITSTFDKKVVQSDEEVTIDYFYNSPNGSGVLYVILNNNQFLKENIGEGSGEINLGCLPKGINNIRIYVIDKADTYTDALQFSITCGTLEITCGFNSDRDYYPESNIVFRFYVDCVNNEKITYHITQNGKDVVEPYTVSKGWNEIIFPKYGPGIYKVEMWCTTASYTSNKISFVLYILAGDSIFMSTTYEKKEIPEGETIRFDYRISMRGQDRFDCVYYIDGIERKRGNVRSGTDYWNITDLPMGTHIIKIVGSTVDGQYATELEYTITVTESTFEIIKPSTRSIKAWFDSTTKSNSDSNKELWISKYPDIYGNYATATLHGFNFSSNGWIDNKLKCDGNAYVEVDVQPFIDNVVSGGLTIDILFETADVGNQDARVIDCTDVTTVAGCYIDTQYAHIDTKGGKSLKSAFSENTLTHITYVINRDSTYISQNDDETFGKELPNPMVIIYVNGVFTEMNYLSDSINGSSIKLENIDHDQKLYINSRKGIDSFGSCSIRHLRIYDCALTSEEIVINHIADLEDPAQQQYEYNKNFNEENPVMPVMRISTYGWMNPSYDYSKIGKDDKIPVSVSYTAIDQHGGSSFDLDYCLLQYQGTSTLKYAVKNFRLTLYKNNTVDIIEKDGVNNMYDTFNTEKAEKYPYQLFGDDSIGETRFTLKADYMDSAMCNNTGMASFIGDNLYNSKVPAAKYDSRIRSCCDGYPFLLYLDGEYIGIFNFMIDKGADETFGFKRPKDKVSKDEWAENFPCVLGYEGAANSDNTAAAFRAWNPSMKVSMDEWYGADFELRYADDEDTRTSYAEIHRLVDFVDNSSDEDFVKNFDQYINREYCLRYYINAYMMGSVDSLGKNMMISTWDGKIWYFCWYDMDTNLGLDNSGYLIFESDIEMEAGIYNTSQSRLWTRIRTLMHKEIAAEWKKMRDTNYTYENFYDYIYNKQINLIGIHHYNKNIEVKYLPFYKKYSHMIHGNRVEHMKRWVKERFIYLDSYFGYQSKELKATALIRINKSDGNDNTPMSFSIKTYSPQFLSILWRNGSGTGTEDDEQMIQTLRIGRNQTVKFTMPMPDVTDQEVIIYNAPQLKEIGDLTDLKPSVILVGDAVKLTKLVCRNSELLKSVDVSSNTMLQHIDLSGCSKLGLDQAGTTLDVSGCSNLRYLNVYGTSLLSVETSPKGGNLEEIYLPYTVQSIYMARQNNLKSLGIPYNITSNSLYNHANNRYCANLIELHIEDCPYLEEIGINRGSKTNFDDKNLLALSNIRNLTIKNSMDKVEYLDFTNCRALNNVTLSDLYNLKELKFNDLQYHYNTDVLYNFNTINITNCPSIHTIEMSSHHSYDMGGDIYKSSCVFAKGTVLDLSNCVNLTTLKSNYGVEGLEKIILPPSVKNIIFEGDSKRVSDLTTMYVKGKRGNDFVGIDLDGLELDDFCMETLVKVPQVLNLDLVSHKYPVAINMLRDNSLYPYIIPDAIIDLNQYTGTSLRGLFKGISDLENNSYLVNIDEDKYLDKVKDVREMFLDSDIDANTINLFYNKLYNMRNASKLFKNNRNITTLNNLYSSIEEMDEMFYNCSSLRSVDSDIPEGNTTCKQMFYNCINLVTGPSKISNTVSDCEQMFYNCNSLKEGPQVIGTSVTSCKQMFENCYNMSKVFRNIPSSCTTCENMFTNCEKLQEGPIEFGENSNVTILRRMFSNCKLIKEGPQIIPNSVTSCQEMFYGCVSLEEGPTVIGPNVTSCSNMFNGCSSLTTVPSAIPDSVTTCASMFQGCTNITDAPAYLGKSINNLNFMFANSGIRSCPDLPIGAYNAQCCFEGCVNLINAPELSNSTNAQSMFKGCIKLETTPSVIPSSYKNLQNMFENCISLKTVAFSTIPGTVNDESYGCYEMFKGCTSLISGPSIIESGVIGMSRMFEGCSSLEIAPVTLGDTGVDLSGMFSGCSRLVSVSFKLPATAKNLANMFDSCQSLQKGPDRISIAAESCNKMYYNCSSLAVPSEFTSGSTLLSDTGYMYYGTAITVSPSIPSGVAVVSNMFALCKSLVTLTNNAVNATSSNNFLNGCISLTTIKDLNLSNYITIPSNFFVGNAGGCSELANITFTDPSGNGSVKANLDLSFTEVLTSTTLDSLVKVLETRSSSATPLELTVSQKVYDRISNSQKSTIISKNWILKVK